MLARRLLSKPSPLPFPFCFVALISSSPSPSPSQSQSHHHPPLIQNPSSSSALLARFFSTNHGNNNNNGNGGKIWNISPENEEESIESVFGGEVRKHNEEEEEEESWFSSKEKGNDVEEEDVILKVIESERSNRRIDSSDWKFGGEGDQKDEIFDIGGGDARVSELELELKLAGIDDKLETQKNKEQDRLLEIEEKALSEVLKGPDHAFGDLIAASGITDDMLDSLMALKDLDDVPGLPPLSEIEELRYERNTKKSTRADIERQKQEEIAKSRVREVDSQGRAYGTGKRKCSIARVWVEPGDGKFVINDKQFDVYFPMLDQRAALLRPLSETKTLGLLDVNCTVKGGGVSGQIGAIRLGMSRALQNWAPEQFRPPLKEAGFLTRDSRVVERKKPGKAKARKSFQWVKRLKMAAIAVHQFADCITCHSWSPDHSNYVVNLKEKNLEVVDFSSAEILVILVVIALCPNNNEVHIFKLAEGKWERVHVLQKHDQIIAGIDWSKSSNRIVTVSHDRNSYVWNHEGSIWVPTLVILRLNRAALCVQWSPKGNKFAVGSGAKTVCICYYEQENNWWVSKLIRKRHDSSVTSVAWHPNNVHSTPIQSSFKMERDFKLATPRWYNKVESVLELVIYSSYRSWKRTQVLIATTSTDGKCRVFSTFIKGVDAGKPKKSGSGSSDIKFGEQIVQLDLSMCWAFGVKWSPSGNSLAYVGHNSMIYFVDEVGPSPSAQSVVLRDLPLRDVMFVSEKLVIGVGYDCNPMVFAADRTGLWSFIRFLDEKKAASSSARYGAQLTEAFGKFYGSSKQGTSNDKSRGGVHDNCINCIVPLKKSESTKLSSFSTSGLDGRVVVWDLKNQEDLVEYL
ncbi:hypothetical protein OSB04_008395 [Centaurea solstitialis]|uniref:Arp2/3 complex 41 kDa subunit n=1 Tax=Centaurea solstitialis TaxID=347529 RepID=A0AA38TLP6_9ASTR|nr:hypothetical protein OSB04_008395 [Centaurea solstitialis]